ncbi:LacI family DNA-binding transcriptional regulator [uncultured Azohydromonas sp.]|uniref:LacI family DNA-binding transcriptional regulator n=1 Tax=uncultured Azohydromonas sp. TaxID=487342 RepID=UPI002637205B|nr:substrate-binding domain-containing protein [uncultured Azohydromonas sp.]
MKVNLKLLAQSLGLSQTTVSRALSGYSDVSPATRQRVREAAQALGYQPDPTARRLATGRAEAVGLVEPLGTGTLGDPRFVDILGGLADGLAQAHMELLIAATRRHTELDVYRRLTSARSVDALVVADARPQDERIRFLQERGFPFVACGRSPDAAPHAWFDVDHEAGARIATERLLELGHRRIALIRACDSSRVAALHLEGHLDALRAAGLVPDPALQLESSADAAGGRETVRRLLAASQPPTALLVDNAPAAAGALRELVDRGWQPGQGPSLIVCDDVSEALALPYPVTAVVPPGAAESGAILARLVLELLAGLPAQRLQHLAQPVLVPGATDAPLRQPATAESC